MGTGKQSASLQTLVWTPPDGVLANIRGHTDVLQGNLASRPLLGFQILGDRESSFTLERACRCLQGGHGLPQAPGTPTHVSPQVGSG